MSGFGVAPLVDGVYAEEETGSKRTEAPYAFFRDRLGVPYEKMLLAEDAPRNLAAAEALGVSGVGVYDESMKEYTEMIRAGAGGVSAGLLRPFGAGGAAAVSLPCAKGGGEPEGFDGGIVRFPKTTIPQSASLPAPFTQGAFSP